MLLLQSFWSNGAGPCHIAVNRNVGLLVVSNYAGSTFFAQSIDKRTGESNDAFRAVTNFGAGGSIGLLILFGILRNSNFVDLFTTAYTNN